MEFASSLTSADNNQIQTTFTGSCKESDPSTSVTYVHCKPVTSSAAQQGPSGTSAGKVVPPQQTLESCGTNVPIRCLRTHFTVYQRRELEKVFSQSKYISSQKRQTLSERLGISEEIIQNWFKNRRAKWRKEPSTGSSSASSTMHVSTGPYLHYFAHVPYPSSNLMMRDARMLFGTDATAHASDESP